MIMSDNRESMYYQQTQAAQEPGAKTSLSACRLSCLVHPGTDGSHLCRSLSQSGNKMRVLVRAPFNDWCWFSEMESVGHCSPSAQLQYSQRSWVRNRTLKIKKGRRGEKQWDRTKWWIPVITGFCGKWETLMTSPGGLSYWCSIVG